MARAQSARAEISAANPCDVWSCEGLLTRVACRHSGPITAPEPRSRVVRVLSVTEKKAGKCYASRHCRDIRTRIATRLRADLLLQSYDLVYVRSRLRAIRFAQEGVVHGAKGLLAFRGLDEHGD